MKKRIPILLLSMFVLLSNTYMQSVHAAQVCKVILIDPGHGGFDGGAKSKNGTVEKDLNLSISLKLKEILQKENYKVYLTRESDIALYDSDKKVRQKKVEDLKKRCELKRETSCDIFISIHQNMFLQSSVSGAQVWHSSNEESKKLAALLQESLRNTLDKDNKRQPKDAKEDYRILRDNYPGANVLVECGFLSNSKEEQLLKDEKYQDKIANAIKDAINDFLK
ncbi:MAG: N-acetylmuramoyl-L-alanine amidase CwlD [Clostridiaceae bacterium]